MKAMMHSNPATPLVSKMKPSVLVLDSSILTAELVAQYLAESGTIRVVATVDTDVGAAGLLLHHRPRVLLLDRVPSLVEQGVLVDAVELTRPALVLHSTSPTHTDAELEKAGIQEVVFREVRRLDDLVAAVHRAAAFVPGDPSPQ